MKREHRQDDHHIRPKSRGGGRRRNLVRLPKSFHQCWHQLFQNMTVEETYEFISRVMTPDTEWDYKALDQLRIEIMRSRRR